MVSEVRITQCRYTWLGEVTWRHTAALREQIFDLLELPTSAALVLDVTGVKRIDRTGIALLVGTNQRATKMNRQLILIDDAGLVTTALAGAGVRASFLICTAGPAQNTA